MDHNTTFESLRRPYRSALTRQRMAFACGNLRPFGLLLLLAVACETNAYSYTPESPEVVKLVDKALRFMEEDPKGSNYGDGGYTLKAYTHYKVHHDIGNSMVQKGVAQALEHAGKLSKAGKTYPDKAVYEASIAILLLGDVDPFKYAEQIALLRKCLEDFQYSNGAYGYPNWKTGDTSQCQYAILANWTLNAIGSDFEPKSVAEVMRWMLRVQDPSGAWPYQGIDPGPGKPLINQTSEVGTSMAMAGGSTLLIGGDVLDIWPRPEVSAQSEYEGIPKAIHIFNDQPFKYPEYREEFQKPVLTAIDRSLSYLGRNELDKHHFWFYQLYTLERYQAFLEIAKGKQPEVSPAWYNRVMEELLKLQAPDGSFGKNPPEKVLTPSVCSAFAVLFLIRSTQRAIAASKSGVASGGYKLPDDTTDITMDGTQIKAKKPATEVADLLNILEEDGGSKLEGKSISEDLQLETDPEKRRVQIDRLQRLVRGSQSWQARRVATRLLARSDQLDVVPTLIFALSDPDQLVRGFARDGLRFISRKFDGFGLPDNPSDYQVRDAIKAWKQWYLTIKPGYVFLDEV